MVAPLVIMLREGIEAALIVAIVAAYLKRTGREALLPAVWAGVLAAVALCLVLGLTLTWLSAELPTRVQELFEAVVPATAAGVLTWMLFWMCHAGRTLQRELQGRVERAASAGQTWSLALVGTAFLAVSREGLESVLFLLAVFQQSRGIEAPLGAALGLALAVAFGVGLYRGGRLDLARFFRWTGLFLIFVSAGLLATALHELHEAGLWNALLEQAYDTSGILRETSPLGAVLRGLFGYSASPTIGEAVVYWAYLGPILFLFLRGERLPGFAHGTAQARN